VVHMAHENRWLSKALTNEAGLIKSVSGWSTQVKTRDCHHFSMTVYLIYLNRKLHKTEAGHI